jgi:hypothetical protein
MRLLMVLAFLDVVAVAIAWSADNNNGDEAEVWDEVYFPPKAYNSYLLDLMRSAVAASKMSGNHGLCAGNMQIDSTSNND